MPHHDRDVPTVRATVITVSDTRTQKDDLGGDAAAEGLASAGHQVLTRAVVKDDADAILAAVQAGIDAGANVVITTGGTGIAPRDVTYEAIAALLEKTLDGFGEAFRRLSWAEVGARSILSRAVAGVYRGALVVVLPGSPKAVRLAMNEVLLPVLGHAVGLLR